MNPEQKERIRINEAFIRRAALINGAFALKGSYLTRQYFAAPCLRIPADLDWVATEPASSPEQMRAMLDPWVIAVTEMELDDGVRFRSFRDNAFWRMIDYAMDDDFPTVNTDLDVEGLEIADLSLDVSFNLNLRPTPIALRYQPLEGAAFALGYTIPLALQVAWKIHQTLVRPRFKDLFDLCHLLRHPAFDAVAREQALAAVREECRIGQVDLGRLDAFLGKRLETLFIGNGMAANWHYFRHAAAQHDCRPAQILAFDRADAITDVAHLTGDLAQFLDELYAAMEAGGLCRAAPEVKGPDFSWQKAHFPSDFAKGQAGFAWLKRFVAKLKDGK
jgi:hypothetical protein